MAPPRYNLNAAKNGSTITRLIVGELPRQLLHVKIEGRSYRRTMEDFVLAVHGAISCNDAHAIDTATAATVHAGICRWLLRQKINTMETNDILACSKELLRAKETRDRAVQRLRLDAGPRNVINALNSDPDDESPNPEKDRAQIDWKNVPSELLLEAKGIIARLNQHIKVDIEPAGNANNSKHGW